jgi:hypothetical protein
MHGKFNKTQRANVKAQARRPKPSPKFLAQFYDWLYQVHHDPELPPSALGVLLEIAWPMSSIGQCSWPSLETMARNCGLSKPSAVRLVQQLVARGHLLAEGGRPGRGHATRYRINIIGSEPRAASEAQAVPIDERIRAGNCTAPGSLKGFVADLLDRDPTPLKGFVADLNKKERKKELRERVFNPTDIESAETHSLDRVPESLGHVTPVQDAASLPVNTTEIDAALIPEIKSAPDGALILGEESKPTNTVSNGSSFYIRGVDEIDDGGAAKRTVASDPDAEHFEKYFEALRETYPRRDAADQGRAALHDVLAESYNAGQLRVCLLEGIELRAKGSHAFMSLRAFIADGEKWRPEFLPFNLAQAA